LIHDPKILVLDEPTSDLDFLLRNQMWDLIKRIKRKGTTIIMSSHFLDEIEGLCDRIIILNDSRIKFTGKPSELKRKKDTGLIVKVETREQNYDELESKLAKNYPHAKITKKEHSLEIRIDKPKNHTTEMQKILTTVQNSKQVITDVQYTRAGISEIFQDLHQSIKVGILPRPKKIRKSWFSRKPKKSLKGEKKEVQETL
jgi:ABC-type multidrug transport system ATPase subunit